MKKLLIIVVMFFLLFTTAYALELPAKDYQTTWCKQRRGTTGYVLDDKTRVDCLLDDYAIKFVFAEKWAEAVGQSLYYGLKTNRKAGVVLIMEDPAKESKYLDMLNELAKKYDIKVWAVTSTSTTSKSLSSGKDFTTKMPGHMECTTECYLYDNNGKCIGTYRSCTWVWD